MDCSSTTIIIVVISAGQNDYEQKMMAIVVLATTTQTYCGVQIFLQRAAIVACIIIVLLLLLCSLTLVALFPRRTTDRQADDQPAGCLHYFLRCGEINEPYLSSSVYVLISAVPWYLLTAAVSWLYVFL